MRRSLILGATLVAALALPTLAQASTGTVLSVGHKHHKLQIIAANHAVHAYTYGGRLAGVRRGSELSFTATGSRIGQVKVIGAASRLSFLATVVRSGRGGLVLALGDSQKLRLSSHQLGKSHPRGAHVLQGRAAGGVNVTLNINGLQPGETVLVTESTDVSGNLTITITLPSAGGTGSELTASGLVNNVDSDTFDVITADGSDLNFHMAAAVLANVDMSSCDAVVVSYHVDSQMMIADSVVDNGPPDSGACSEDGGDNGGSGGGSGGGDWIGTITAVSATSITVDAGAGNGGLQTFAVTDPSVSHGFIAGDAVDVSYEQDGSQFVADSISYEDMPTFGVVTAIAAAGNGFDTVTMIDDYSLQSETFYVSTDLLYGQGVQVGDDIGVSYYQAARGLTLDCLQDNGSDS